MNSKVSFIGLLLFFICPQLAFSQDTEGRSGTIYSSYGTGFPLQINTAQEKAMGIPGVSFNDLTSTGLSNPAFWGLGGYTRIAANFDFTSYSIQDGQNEGNNSLLQIGSFQALIPISKNKLGLSVALYPETRSSYNVDSFNSISVGNSELDLFSNRSGTGGIAKFEVGLGYKISDNFSIGYAPSYSFLTESETQRIEFIDGNIVSNTLDKSVNGTAVSHRFGALGILNDVFLDNDIIQLGTSITLPSDFESDQKAETTKRINGSNEIIQIGETVSGNISTPLKYGVGVTYFSGPRFNISAEYLNEKWSESEYDFSIEEESALKDRSLYGIGMQFHPYQSRSDKFLSNFKYSLGMSYDTGHLEIQNEEINTLWFTAGLGLISPSLRSASSFDLSFQYGIRGTTNQDLVKENIFSINLSINLTELMFLQRKLN